MPYPWTSPPLKYNTDQGEYVIITTEESLKNPAQWEQRRNMFYTLSAFESMQKEENFK